MEGQTTDNAPSLPLLDVMCGPRDGGMDLILRPAANHLLQVRRRLAASRSEQRLMVMRR